MCERTAAVLFALLELSYNLSGAITLVKMRVKTMQVMWHDEKPVYSVDFHPSGIFATGGGDKDVKVRPVWGEILALVLSYDQTCCS